MHITIHPHHPVIAQRSDLGQTTPTSPAPAEAMAPATGGSEADEVTLSPEAQAVLSGSEDEARSGQSAKSPAFLARQALPGGTSAAAVAGTEGATDYDGLPFGQVVKQFTPGHLRQAAAAADEADGTVVDPVEDGEAVVADASDIVEVISGESDDGIAVESEDGTDEPVDAVAAAEEEPDLAPEVGTADADAAVAALLEELAEDTEADI